MSRVTLDEACKAFGPVEAIRGISADFGDGEFVVLVGPSGSGKSTLLRLIAGLEAITSGTVAIDGEVVNGRSNDRRDVGAVFRDGDLHPHMTVAENLGLPLRLRDADRASVEDRVASVAALLGIGPLLDRLPLQLSDGQRQRVVLGQAILRNPRLLLLDEPLAGLDAPTRAELRAALREAQARMGATALHATHDQAEAMALADRLVVLRDGRVEQEGRPLDLWDRPATAFVAGFLGSPGMNLLDGTLGPGGLALGAGAVLPLAPRGGRAGDRLTLGVRPEHLHVLPAEDPDGLPATLRGLEPLGTGTLLAARLSDGRTIRAQVPGRPRLRPGERVSLLPDPSRLHWFDAAGRRFPG